MKTTLYVLPIAGAGMLSIVATQPSRRVEIVEDDSGTAQGLIYKIQNDGTPAGYTTAFEAAPGREPIILGNTVANAKGRGPWVGLPIQKDQGGTVTLRPATVLLMATSATGTGTKVRVTEYD